jgi:hypothetical protein
MASFGIPRRRVPQDNRLPHQHHHRLLRVLYP